LAGHAPKPALGSGYVRLAKNASAPTGESEEDSGDGRSAALCGEHCERLQRRSSHEEYADEGTEVGSAALGRCAAPVRPPMQVAAAAGCELEEPESGRLGEELGMWEPTLGKVARPHWLPTRGLGNMKVEPEEWGMTIQQFCAFIMACFMGEGDDGGKLRTYAKKTPQKTKAKDANHVTLYEIVDHFVKPWTQNTGNSIALLMNCEKPLKAEVMISHAWGEDIIEAMVALLGKAYAMKMPLTTVVWFCAFAQYQPGDAKGDCGPSVAEQLSKDPFKRVIGSRPTFGMIVLHTSRAELYERLWCVYEVNEAKKAEVEPHAAFSMNYLKEYYFMRERGVGDECFRVDTSSAKCSCPGDMELIHTRIKEAHEGMDGFKALDDKISRFRCDALEPMYQVATSFFEWSRKHGDVGDVRVLRDKTRTAGVFVALHCLLGVCDAVEDFDERYRQRILRLAREAVRPLAQPPHESGTPPPGFDPKKACPEMLTRLTAGLGCDALLDACLSDLSLFELPIGYLEMSSGGAPEV